MKSLILVLEKVEIFSNRITNSICFFSVILSGSLLQASPVPPLKDLCYKALLNKDPSLEVKSLSVLTAAVEKYQAGLVPHEVWAPISQFIYTRFSKLWEDNKTDLKALFLIRQIDLKQDHLPRIRIGRDFWQKHIDIRNLCGFIEQNRVMCFDGEGKKVYDLDSGQQEGYAERWVTLNDEKKEVSYPLIEVSADGSLGLSIKLAANGIEAYLIQMKTMDVLQYLSLPEWTRGVKSARFSPDNRLLALITTHSDWIHPEHDAPDYLWVFQLFTENDSTVSLKLSIPGTQISWKDHRVYKFSDPRLRFRDNSSTLLIGDQEYGSHTSGPHYSNFGDVSFRITTWLGAFRTLAWSIQEEKFLDFSPQHFPDLPVVLSKDGRFYIRSEPGEAAVYLDFRRLSDPIKYNLIAMVHLEQESGKLASEQIIQEKKRMINFFQNQDIPTVVKDKIIKRIRSIGSSTCTIL